MAYKRHRSRGQPRELSHQLGLIAADVAGRLLGPPNRKASSKHELRYGRRGSLAVHIAGPKRGRWSDFESGRGGDLLDLIQREHRCSLGEACVFAADLLGIRQEDDTKLRPRSAPKPEPKKGDADRTRGALQIWGEAGTITGTPGALYLTEQRGIDLDAVPDLNDVLRWHPRCPWGEGGARHPCVVALWTHIHSVEPKAIHRRPINAAGKQADRWKALGPTASCVIRLWCDECVEYGLVLGEGIETTLSAATRVEHLGTLLRPAWAAGDAGHVAGFPVLAGIDALTLLVDHDASGTGQAAAAECAARWVAAGKEVIRLTPRAVDTDFNDLVREVAP